MIDGVGREHTSSLDAIDVGYQATRGGGHIRGVIVHGSSEEITDG